MAADRLVEDLLALWRLLRINTHPVRRGEITPEQYWLLKLLNKKVELSIGELAEALGVTGSSVTTACNAPGKIRPAQTHSPGRWPG